MKITQTIVLFLAAALFITSCSKTSSENNNGTNNTTYPIATPSPLVVAPVIIDPTAPTTTTGSTVFTSGSTVDFQPASLALMNEYVATHPLNNPTNFKVNINLAQSGAGRYGGQVTISYFDNGIQYNGEFKAGMGKNQSYKGMYDNDRLEADYNYWFTFENKLVFTGFFEDQYGAITIALEPINSQTPSGNDAEPVSSGPYRGYVYFKNFTTSFAQHSPYRSCWYTYMGPYDCRSNIIQTKCGLNPGAEAGYKLLGTFTNVDINKAFNIN